MLKPLSPDPEMPYPVLPLHPACCPFFQVGVARCPWPSLGIPARLLKERRDCCAGLGGRSPGKPGESEAGASWTRPERALQETWVLVG